VFPEAEPFDQQSARELVTGIRVEAPLKRARSDVRRRLGRPPRSLARVKHTPDHHRGSYLARSAWVSRHVGL